MDKNKIGEEDFKIIVEGRKNQKCLHDKYVSQELWLEKWAGSRNWLHKFFNSVPIAYYCEDCGENIFHLGLCNKIHLFGQDSNTHWKHNNF